MAEKHLSTDAAWQQAKQVLALGADKLMEKQDASLYPPSV
jgi:hypothetical protein